MQPCHVVEIETPKKVRLNGLWFGPKRPKRAILWVHGLGSSAFSKIGIFDYLIDKDTAVLAFNNRGHDKVSSSSVGKSAYALVLHTKSLRIASTTSRERSILQKRLAQKKSILQDTPPVVRNPPIGLRKKGRVLMELFCSRR